MTKPDHFEAARSLAALLEPFDAASREKIVRWAREELGMTAEPPSARVALHDSGHAAPPVAAQQDSKHPRTSTDLRTFFEAKSPKTDQHFAAVIAYYHRFEAPEGARKSEITPDDYLEGCRIAPWRRPRGDALFTLRNALNSGLFDKGSGSGSFALNTVGENLVAMALPTKASSPDKLARRRNNGRAAKSKKRKTQR